MPLVVSCLSDGLFLVDGDGVSRLDHVPSSGLAATRRGLVRARHDPAETARGGVLDLGRATAPVPGLADPHELAADGSLLAGVATLANAVVWMRPDGRPVRIWRAPGEGDCWHLSGIAADAGRIAVTAFGRFERHRDWAEAERDRTGFVLDLQEGRVLADGLASPHSPRFVDRVLAYCDSGRGDLVVGGRRVPLGGWTRGLAVTARHLVVGVSARRRSAARARLAFVRRGDLAVTRTIEIPAAEIFEVADAGADRAAEVARPGYTPAPSAPLAPSDLCAAVAAPVELRLRAGRLADVPCLVTNAGSVTLPASGAHGVSLVGSWDPPGRALWSPLPAPLGPGRSVDVRARVLAPDRRGRHRLSVGLVQEGVASLVGGTEVEVVVV